MKTILVVDDDHMYNFLMSKTLEKMNLVEQTYTALDGREALTILDECYRVKGSLPDVILLDLRMPEMDGFEFLKSYHKMKWLDKDRVRIVMISTLFESSDIEKAKALGVSVFLSKPIHEEELRTIIIQS